MNQKQPFPPDSQAYFDSLPKFLQESIMQAGMTFNTREELQTFCEHITG